MATNSAQGSGSGATPATIQKDPPPAGTAEATTDTSGTTTDTATTSAMIGFSDGWPNWAKPVFALAVAAIGSECRWLLLGAFPRRPFRRAESWTISPCWWCWSA